MNKQQTVLIVNDDELTIDNMVRDIQSDPGYKVYRVLSGSDLDVVLDSESKIDLALVDIRLSIDQGFTKTGFEIAKMLLDKGIKVGMTTAAIREKDTLRAKEMAVPVFDPTIRTVQREKFIYLNIVNELAAMQKKQGIEGALRGKETEV